MSDDNQIYKRSVPEERSSLNNFLNYDDNAMVEDGDGMLPTVKQDIRPNNPLQPKKGTNHELKKIDRPAFFVLVALYLLQGVPVGLAFGSVPFILKSKLSYAQVGVFSLAAYPYSLKLLWSPIVDSIYSKRVGRRKSWIIPIQSISGAIMIYLGSKIEILMQHPELHLSTITACFFLLVLFCATQDIAVDGWALTCLSPESLSYASTAQTIGINTGYFSSFTIFLALSSPHFANKFLRSQPKDDGLFSLGQYLKFWGWMYLIITLVLYFVPEDPPHLARFNKQKLSNEKVKDEDVSNRKISKLGSIIKVYSSMYQVLKLPNIQTLVIILLIAKFPFQVNEAVTNLKLIEKGLSKEELSITVLIDFPFELIFGYYAGRWSTGKRPLSPWVLGFCGRLLAAIFAQFTIYLFPSSGEVTAGYFFLVILQHLMTSFMSTIQFVSLCAFHTTIADPTIGGTYMTALNTLSNYGGTWPKLIIFLLIDKITLKRCESPSIETFFQFEVTSDELAEECKKLGGIVRTYHDGYFYMNIVSVILGFIIILWIKSKITHLEELPSSAWRVNKS